MIKQVAVIDDIAGYGKCSLGIIIPVLNSASIEVYPGITSLYSTHTPIKGYTKLDTGSFLNDTIASWKKLNVSFDAILTAALTSKEQIYACTQLFADNPNALKVVDPVLGDFGDFYDDDFKALLPHMKKLCAHADIITPNQTEAQLLCNTKESEPNKLFAELKKLSVKGVVIKGIINDNKISNYYINKDGSFYVSTSDYYDAIIHGAGDMFTSTLVAKLLNNMNIEDALDFATSRISEAVALTIKEPGYENKGILFEPFLKK